MLRLSKDDLDLIAVGLECGMFHATKQSIKDDYYALLSRVTKERIDRLEKETAKAQSALAARTGTTVPTDQDA